MFVCSWLPLWVPIRVVMSATLPVSLAFNISQRSLGPTDWWIGLSIGQPGEEVRCVCHGAHSSFCTMASSLASAYFNSLFCRWSDKTDLEFQNWAKVSGRTRKNGLCVTMSSSTGEDLQRHSRLWISSLRLFWRWAFECVCVCVAGKWSASKCSEPHGYICKRKTVSVVETPREPHYIGHCPEKWLYFGHKVQTHNCWQNLYKNCLDAILFNYTSCMHLKSRTYC